MPDTVGSEVAERQCPVTEEGILKAQVPVFRIRDLVIARDSTKRGGGNSKRQASVRIGEILWSSRRSNANLCLECREEWEGRWLRQVWNRIREASYCSGFCSARAGNRSELIVILRCCFIERRIVDELRLFIVRGLAVQALPKTSYAKPTRGE